MKKFGKYLLERQLAIGGMAEVFLARQHGPAGFEKTLVLKRILPHFANDEAFITMFLDEARTSAQLNHPNLVQIYELGEIDGSYYIAMEYIRGQSVVKVIRKLKKEGMHMPLHLAAKVIASACAGLDYAHNFADRDGDSLRLIHRDVSPDNILVSYDGAVKMIDFGIAKAKDSQAKTQAGAVKGKFCYMSPEQVTGKSLDRRSDIFSLGICLHELTTLSKPFGEGADLMTVTSIVNDPPLHPSKVLEGYPEGLWDIVEKALAKKREDRFATAHEMQIALERFIHSRGVFLSDRDIGNYVRRLFSDRAEDLEELRELASGIKSRVMVPPSSAKMSAPAEESTAGAAHAPTEIHPTTGALDKTIVKPSPSTEPADVEDDIEPTVLSTPAMDTTRTATEDRPSDAAEKKPEEAKPSRTSVVAEPPPDGPGGGAGKWIAIAAAVALLGAGGWFGWQQFGPQPDGGTGGDSGTEIAGGTSDSGSTDSGSTASESTAGESIAGSNASAASGTTGATETTTGAATMGATGGQSTGDGTGNTGEAGGTGGESTTDTGSDTGIATSATGTGKDPSVRAGTGDGTGGEEATGTGDAGSTDTTTTTGIATATATTGSETGAAEGTGGAEDGTASTGSTEATGTGETGGDGTGETAGTGETTGENAGTGDAPTGDTSSSTGDGTGDTAGTAGTTGSTGTAGDTTGTGGDGTGETAGSAGTAGAGTAGDGTGETAGTGTGDDGTAQTATTGDTGADGTGDTGGDGTAQTAGTGETTGDGTGETAGTGETTQTAGTGGDGTTETAGTGGTGANSGTTAGTGGTSEAQKLPAKLIITASERSRVRIDGKLVGHTPLTNSLPAGAHTVRVKGASIDKTWKITVAAGATKSLHAPALARRGTITFRVPRGTIVKLDGRKVGTAPVKAQKVTLGRHKVELINPDNSAQRVRRTVRLTTARPRTIISF